MLSILTPAFNEADNLEALHSQMVATMTALGGDWEWLIVDDHSRDATFSVIERIAARDPHVRGIRLARNSGSHVAIACGLHHVRGEAAVMMAADLQDPPAMLGAMRERWREGAQVVWATRRESPGSRSHGLFARFYYWIMRNVVGMRDMPARGADFFLIDRVVIEGLRRFRERNVSVLALVTWLGFRQVQIEYDKQPRAAGKSGWTLQKKIKLVLDSVIGFSDVPIRLCSYLGVVLLLASVLIGVYAIASFSTGTAWVLTAMVALSGVNLMALGLVGEYVWRGLDEARARPAYLIEALAGVHEPSSFEQEFGGREAIQARQPASTR
jgi:polyisoprenyl-phosphate glycosyltransferase